jgi:hypothetical protein
MIASEIALRSNKISKNNSFAQGFISGPFFHNLYQIIRNETGNSNNQYEYFETMKNAGLSKSITYPLILGFSALQAWRGLKQKGNKNDLTKTNFNVIPLEGGLALNVSKRF